ncbi:ABC transporter permease [Methylovirgula sp. 4M-Z18]|uniref:ABC transporter permease n=1 Tax=Methylovirgula sp. 4M-Z18 TaxID=2293567 RepID=UPI000E2F8108|nr:ABC transporter permease subunit [Methylovirgula sp. 4M-Z18]RFB80568.1 ABC transporter permease subunit [Methylovirgula sp. 4M-Z18]
MFNWVTDTKLPFGHMMQVVIEFFQSYCTTWFFDPLRLVIESVVSATSTVLTFLPPPVIILIILVFAYWRFRSIGLMIFILLGCLFIWNQGYWEDTMKTVALVAWSAAVAMVIGIPVGVMSAHRPKWYRVIHPILDMMQTLPTLVYLIPMVALFRLGAAPGLIATLIFALPAPIRLTYLGISSTPTALKEAGEAFGSTKRQLLWKVELPHAMPTIMAGVTQCIMLSLSMVVIAGLVGAEGLGVDVVRAMGQFNIPRGFEAGACIVILAIILDRLCRVKEAH